MHAFVGLLLFGAVGLGLLFVLAMILRAFTGRSHRRHTTVPASGPRQHRVAMIVMACFVVAGLFLAVPLLFWVRMKTPGSHDSVTVINNTSSSGTIVAQAEPALPKTPDPSLPVGSPADAESKKAATADTAANQQDVVAERSQTNPLPDWTQKKQTIVAQGQVPTVLFVETSGLYSSEAEAMSEAVKKAVSRFRSRLAETYRELATQPVPENLFREASIQQVYTETRIHHFGAYDEPMYRVYLQYMDSAEAREPIIEAWKSTFAGNRAIQYGIGFGVLLTLLGVVSAGLRAVSAAKGSRGRSVMTALFFAGVGLTGLLFIS
jgi:hypothetical protein